MGNDGSRAPKPWKQYQAATLFLRVPSDLWIDVTTGRKTEFRGTTRFFTRRYSFTPSPVVAYRYRQAHGYEPSLMVLEKVWEEPLGAISSESLEREGFKSLADFRKDWCRRHSCRFEPLRMVTVFRLRPREPGEERTLGESLLQRLYGEFLP